LLGIANRVAGMDAHIAQGVKPALAVAGHDDRSRRGVEAKEIPRQGEPRLMIGGEKRPQEDPLPLGGKDVRIAEEGRIGRDLAGSTELFSESGDADRKIHRRVRCDRSGPPADRQRPGQIEPAPAIPSKAFYAWRPAMARGHSLTRHASAPCVTCRAYFV